MRIRFNPRLLEFAGHYHFAPKPVARARGNEKGRVERAIRYVRDSFFAARSYRSLEDLNGQLDEWIERVAHARLVPGDGERRSVQAALCDERPRLLPLPANPFPCDAVRTLRSGKTPYLRFDSNDYSIPHTLTQTPLLLVASDRLVRVLDGETEVASHKRCWDRGRQVEDPRHFDGLEEDKRRAREHRGRNRLMAACPHAQAFLEKVAAHGQTLGATTRFLLRLLDSHGPSELDFALNEASQRGAFAAQSVAHILEQRRRGRKATVPVPIVLPDDPRVRDLRVPPRSLAAYDALARSGDKQNGGAT